MKKHISLLSYNTPAAVFERAHLILSGLGFVEELRCPTRARWRAPERDSPTDPLFHAERLCLEIDGDQLTIEADLSRRNRRHRKGYWIMALLMGASLFILTLFTDDGSRLLNLLLFFILAGGICHQYMASGQEEERLIEESLRGLLRNLTSPGAPGSEAPKLRPRGPAQVCSYCRDALGAEPEVVCRRCETRVHLECWQEHGACPSLGCAKQRRSRATKVADRD